MRFIPNAVTFKVARSVLIAQKNSPKLLFAGGVIGVVATAVAAGKATLRVEDVLDENREKMEMAKTVHESNHPKYSDLDYRRDMTQLYIQSAVQLGRLYGPTLVLGAATIACFSKSNDILNERNAALTAAYAAVSQSFARYRQRVVKEYGEDKDREFLHSVEERTIVEETDKGPKKKRIKHFGSDGHSAYARLFQKGNPNWEPTPEYNILFLRLQQRNLTNRLHATGHVFLNDAYDALGLERSSEGAVMGWIFDPQGNIDGDNYVDFGIWADGMADRLHDFVTGREGAILLDFNVDEKPIWDKI